MEEGRERCKAGERGREREWQEETMRRTTQKMIFAPKMYPIEKRDSLLAKKNTVEFPIALEIIMSIKHPQM